MDLIVSISSAFSFALYFSYVIERINADEPSRRISSEDLGGRPNEQKDPQMKEVVGQLLKIADQIDNDVEFQRSVKRGYNLIFQRQWDFNTMSLLFWGIVCEIVSSSGQIVTAGVDAAVLHLKLINSVCSAH